MVVVVLVACTHLWKSLALPMIWWMCTFESRCQTIPCQKRGRNETPKTAGPRKKWWTQPKKSFKKARVESLKHGEAIRTKFGMCMAACVKKLKLFKWAHCVMRPWVVCWVHVSIFEKIIGHCLWFDGCAPLEVDVRPSPVRKEVETKPSSNRPPQTDQHSQKKLLKWPEFSA